MLCPQTDPRRRINGRHPPDNARAVIIQVGGYGGEEFALLLPSTPLDQAVMVLAERLRAAIEETLIVVGEQTLRVTASLGVAGFRPQGGRKGVERLGGDTDLDHLLNRADAALYTAKHSGRNRVVEG